jgi:hypothetical protein
MAFNISNWLMRTKIDAHVRRSGKPMEQRRVVNPYHAVEVSPALGCCKAAVDLKGRRFLSAEAPKLPLPGCDAASCRCRFVHHNDRRMDDDRRQLIVNPLGHQMRDRRRGRGSRNTD